jgi:YfiH family protein
VKPLREPLLCALAPDHGFGVRGSSGPPGLACPRQVHGAVVVRAEACLAAEPAEADGVISLRGGPPVGVVTADCVPVLLASDDGAGVAALHAGWRGLAAGVLEAGVRALAEASGAAPGGFAAGVGPHIGACCYEVDEPVLEALARRHAEAAPRTAPRGPGRGPHRDGQRRLHRLRGGALPLPSERRRAGGAHGAFHHTREGR